jgi:hypothetical protein
MIGQNQTPMTMIIVAELAKILATIRGVFQMEGRHWRLPWAGQTMSFTTLFPTIYILRRFCGVEPNTLVVLRRTTRVVAGRMFKFAAM